MTARKPATNSARSTRIAMSSLSALCIATSALTMTACASSTEQSGQGIPANLKQPCQALQPLLSGDGKAVTNWALNTVQAHEDCANKVQRLIEAWPK